MVHTTSGYKYDDLLLSFHVAFVSCMRVLGWGLPKVILSDILEGMCFYLLD